MTSTDAPVLFRHSGWQRNRLLVRDALEAAGAAPRRLLRFDLCGSDPWVVRDPNDPGRISLHTSTCRSRWCLPCAQAAGARVAANLERLLASRRCRFLTLTLAHSADPLRHQLDRLTRSFAKLRQTKLWKACVTGGASVLEVHHSYRDDFWHPHLHILIEGRYIPHAGVSKLWRRITGDSYVVHVTTAYDSATSARYLAKYLRKPLHRTVINKPDALRTLIAALRGKRLMTTFGSWRGYRLHEPLDETDWQPICPLPVLFERAQRGDLESRTLLATLEVRYPGLLGLYNTYPP